MTDAYAKYQELQRIAPNSRYVNDILARLNAMRQHEELTRLQVAQAQAKYTEGMTLFTEKKYADAIVRFQEALAINANHAEASAQLVLAQAELQKIEAARLARQQQRQKTTQATTTVATATETTAPTQTVAAEPVQITTVFAHPFTDGRITVRIGGDIVANEQLYTERRRRVIGTLVREPRSISVGHEFPAKNADVEVWVTVPAQKVQEHHRISGVRFAPGSTHRLIVHYNATQKTFSYELN